MRKVFRFFLKKIHWVFFLFGICASIFLLLNNQQFQKSSCLTIVREFRGYFYSVFNFFFSYAHFDDTNAELIKKISEIETELYSYKRIVELYNDSDRYIKMGGEKSVATVYKFIPARVVDNSVSFIDNYIIINKGVESGVRKDMGVITIHGVVGVILSVSNHFSEAISLLNSHMKLSCKLKKNHFFGLLVWDGKNAQYTYLSELPSTVSLHQGDTVVTSGYSAVFPEGIPVGVIAQSKKNLNGFSSVKVKLFTQFECLHEVLIIENNYQKEQKFFKKKNNFINVV